MSKLLFIFLTILKFDVTQKAKFSEQKMYLYSYEDCFYDGCGVQLWCDTRYEERWYSVSTLFEENKKNIITSNYCNGTMPNILDHKYR